MALVTVTRNAADNYTVALSERAVDILRWWSNRLTVSMANALEQKLIEFFRDKARQKNSDEGPTLAQKYDAMTPAQKAIVDPVFASVTVTED